MKRRQEATFLQGQPRVLGTCLAFKSTVCLSHRRCLPRRRLQLLKNKTGSTEPSSESGLQPRIEAEARGPVLEEDSAVTAVSSLDTRRQISWTGDDRNQVPIISMLYHPKMRGIRGRDPFALLTGLVNFAY